LNSTHARTQMCKLSPGTDHRMRKGGKLRLQSEEFGKGKSSRIFPLFGGEEIVVLTFRAGVRERASKCNQS